jgi:hypothetical protein
MPFTNPYDVTFPPDTELANLLGNNLRALALNVQQRMAAISGISTAMPNFAADVQPANWTGILFFATDNGHIYQFNGAAWVDITASFALKTLSYFAADATAGILIPAGVVQPGSIIEISAVYNFSVPTGTSNIELKASGAAFCPIGFAAVNNQQLPVYARLICGVSTIPSEAAFFSQVPGGTPQSQIVVLGSGAIPIIATVANTGGATSTAGPLRVIVTP